MKITGRVAFLLTGCLLLAGCGGNQEADPFAGNGSTVEGQNGTGQENRDSLPALEGENGGDDEEESQGGEAERVKYRIVDGAESGDLVLAGEGWGSVYTLFLGDNSEVPVYLDGEIADRTMLEDGMKIGIAGGYVMETFPGQLGGDLEIYAYSRGTEQNPGGGYYDLCGLYLKVLDDLWERDNGLNSDVQHVSVDLSEAPGELTDGEKSAIAWIFGCQHQVESLTMTQEELAEAGYLTELELSSKNKLYQWEDGVLFRITAIQWEEGETYSLPVIKFNADKWRSPRGAYFFSDCFAVWPEMGTWSDYEIGGEAIS
ncbi:MAG: hypothetical protein HFH87_00835 [Lachnospiraceae bacterium]|nr:hypothetical protein [Lachnospiraceae bacterium]